MDHHTYAQAAGEAPKSRELSWACIKVRGPGAGAVSFADGDLGALSPDFYCTQNHRAQIAFKGLEWIESELFKLATKKLLPPPR